MKKRWVLATFAPSKLREIRKEIARKKLDIEVYCPMQKISISKKGRIRFKNVPLYFNYFFLRCRPDILTNRNIGLLPMKLVKFKKDIVIVTKKQLQQVMDSEAEQAKIFEQMRTDEEFLTRLIGRRVLIRSGNLDGVEADIKSVKGKGMLGVEIYIFGRFIDIEVPVDYVELLTE